MAVAKTLDEEAAEAILAEARRMQGMEKELGSAAWLRKPEDKVLNKRFVRNMVSHSVQYNTRKNNLSQTSRVQNFSSKRCITPRACETSRDESLQANQDNKNEKNFELKRKKSSNQLKSSTKRLKVKKQKDKT